MLLNPFFFFPESVQDGILIKFLLVHSFGVCLLSVYYLLGSARSWKYSDGHDGPCFHGIYSLAEKIVIEQISDIYSDLITVVVNATRQKVKCTIEVINMRSALSQGLEMIFLRK